MLHQFREQKLPDQSHIYAPSRSQNEHLWHSVLQSIGALYGQPVALLMFDHSPMGAQVFTTHGSVFTRNDLREILPRLGEPYELIHPDVQLEKSHLVISQACTIACQSPSQCAVLLLLSERHEHFRLPEPATALQKLTRLLGHMLDKDECDIAKWNDCTTQDEACNELPISLKEPASKEATNLPYFDENPVATLIVARETLQILKVNEAACTLLNTDGRKLSQFTYDQLHTQHDRQELRARVSSGEGFEPTGERWNLMRPNGTNADHILFSKPVQYQGHACLFISLVDISEQQRREEYIKLAATQDPLTRLPNRQCFEKLLTNAIKDGRTTGNSFALALLDLDHFKQINDTRGHTAGDKVLRKVANRLLSLKEQGHIVARLGGDEFAVIVKAPTRAEQTTVLTTLHSRLGGLVMYDGHKIRPQFSIGAAVYPIHATRAETLAKHADLALYDAKNRGRDRLCIFDDKIKQKQTRRLAIKDLTKSVLEGNDIRLCYQPVQCLRTKKTDQYECLFLWPDHLRKLASRQEIRSILEEQSLDEAVTSAFFRHANQELGQILQQAPDLRGFTIRPLHRLFKDPNLPIFCENLLTKLQLPSSKLTLEVPENSIISGATQLQRANLGRLVGERVQLSLGHLALADITLPSLHHFNISSIKVKANFLQLMNAEPQKAKLLKASIEFARNMGIELIVTNVKTQQQLEFAHKLGCTHAMGSAIGQPLTADELCKC
ncbi:diguanylate cyclase [Rhodobacteraceae bacterium RKSG542]|uniref:diguanylate cyclase domain-containing protein n=1 Tax=Pseudovibrio flavus TaxID=2529854 RepID=UPI0012BCB447|nr:diguanylate cyclase [Pseudovibrio flavus]MTI19110.1 diguanylate cyclase [Pseudovibrio flavus]